MTNQLMANQQSRVRLLQLLNLVEKEARHLKDVTLRLFAILPAKDEKLSEKLNEPQLIDTLESFTAKFSRMQDTIADKLLPIFLQTAGEQTGTVIENLNRAEKLSLISDTQQWLIARGLRNKLVHEYIEDAHELLEALELARQFVPELISTYTGIKTYTNDRLNIK
jgi:molybdopterin converting factor small subunit